MNPLEANLRAVRDRIAAAAARAGRDSKEITLVAVTKTQSPDMMRAAYDLGLRDFGENRVEEAEEKVNHLPAKIRWHMIGHIQSRKAKRVLPIFDFIHSIDSLKLARRLDRRCADFPAPFPVLLEFNVSGEASKYGFSAARWEVGNAVPAALMEEIEEIVSLPHLQVDGLMTMAPIVSHAEEARPVFLRLQKLRNAMRAAFPQTDWKHLSMGMTDDFEVAIEEGATIIRVGRAIFAPQVPSWRKS
jgi:pyridoxal phosphate enzyme (YggS family)